MAEDRFYSCFNFCLRSALPLPELAAAESAGEAGAAVDVRLGKLPEFLPGGRSAGHGLQVADGAVMLAIEGIARYLVRDGREIVVEPGATGSELNLRLFLLGSALGILCHQRGLLPLHANAVVAGGEAFAFAGSSGAGKSTLAAHFQRLGYEILCDDVCAISFDDAEQPYAWPGLRRLKLWGDAAAAFGHETRLLDLAIEGADKYHVPLAGRFAARPVPLRRLYVLERPGETEAGTVTRLRGAEAIETVLKQTYRGLYLGPMGLRARQLRQCAALLAHVGVYAASRAWGYDVFEREAGRLERHLSVADESQDT